MNQSVTLRVNPDLVNAYAIKRFIITKLVTQFPTDPIMVSYIENCVVNEISTIASKLGQTISQNVHSITIPMKIPIIVIPKDVIGAGAGMYPKPNMNSSPIITQTGFLTSIDCFDFTIDVSILVLQYF